MTEREEAFLIWKEEERAMMSLFCHQTVFLKESFSPQKKKFSKLDAFKTLNNRS